MYFYEMMQVYATNSYIDKSGTLYTELFNLIYISSTQNNCHYIWPRFLEIINIVDDINYNNGAIIMCAVKANNPIILKEILMHKKINPNVQNGKPLIIAIRGRLY